MIQSIAHIVIRSDIFPGKKIINGNQCTNMLPVFVVVKPKNV